ncbi:hypothetical protein ACSV5M_00275 [Cellvibrio sp. ARAG 10.3]|uniref:hypothetical protein n=1 Tax=Cellvibrio sp. ARAG 10.3 TaxID=3451358 RepID=UPI003F46B1C2
MTRALNWESVNRNAKAHKAAINPVILPRKNSTIDLAKKLEAAVRLIKSDEWATKTPGFKAQTLSQLANSYKKLSKIKPSFKLSPIGKSAKKILKTSLL